MTEIRVGPTLHDCSTLVPSNSKITSICHVQQSIFSFRKRQVFLKSSIIFLIFLLLLLMIILKTSGGCFIQYPVVLFSYVNYNVYQAAPNHRFFSCIMMSCTCLKNWRTYHTKCLILNPGRVSVRVFPETCGSYIAFLKD